MVTKAYEITRAQQSSSKPILIERDIPCIFKLDFNLRYEGKSLEITNYLIG